MLDPLANDQFKPWGQCPNGHEGPPQPDGERSFTACIGSRAELHKDTGPRCPLFNISMTESIKPPRA